MRIGRRTAAVLYGLHQPRAAVWSLACIGSLAIAMVLLNPAAVRADPQRQLTVAQSGVRLRLGQFVLGPNWVMMTVIVENERDTPVRLAALVGRDSAQAVLSDEHGNDCRAAEGPKGIAEIPAPADETRTATASMTDVPAHSTTKVLFSFPHCRLSRSSLLSLSTRFGLSTNGRDVERFPAAFRGIVQKTMMR